jgi:alkylated DNA repair protein alkB homolog 6
MPHEDGAAYHPVVPTVSLGGSVVLDVTEKTNPDDLAEDAAAHNRKTWRILQEPRSLLVTTGAAYTETLHGIAEISVDENLTAETVANWSLLQNRDEIVANGNKNQREIRISLTFRDVLKGWLEDFWQTKDLKESFISLVENC